MSVKTLPEIAEKVSEIFPELDGRALAVSEAEINSDNTPTLPLAMVALVNVSGNDAGFRNGLAAALPITEDFIIEILLPPVRKKTATGAETPFWTFYNYRDYLNRLLTGLKTWHPFQFVTMDLSADAFSVALTFRFRQAYEWCPLSDDEESVIIERYTLNTVGC